MGGSPPPCSSSVVPTSAARPQAHTSGFTRSPLRPARQGTAMTVKVLSREARLAGVRNSAQLWARYLHTAGRGDKQGHAHRLSDNETVLADDQQRSDPAFDKHEHSSCRVFVFVKKERKCVQGQHTAETAQTLTPVLSTCPLLVHRPGCVCPSAPQSRREGTPLLPK